MWCLFTSTCILHLLLAEATASLQNVALLKGQTLTYKCNMNIETHLHSWYFIPFGKNVEKIIYSTKEGLNGQYVKRAKVDNSSLVLTIPNIQLDDAGIYGCRTLHYPNVIDERAQVVVIASKLQVCVNEASRQTCEVKYKGNFAPVIEWTKDGSTELTAINSTLRNDSDANGTRHLTLITNSVNSTLTCQLYFKDFPTHFENMSTNIPTYTDRCDSSVCCYSSSETTMTSPGSKGRPTQDSVPYPLVSAIIGAFLLILIIVVIGLILEKKQVQTIPTACVDDTQQADVDTAAQIGEPQRFRRLGYEEMQTRESPSEASYARLNPADTARPLPYVNVALEERRPEPLATRDDRPHQYLNVVIEHAACSMSDGVAAAKMQSYVNVSLQRDRDTEDVEL